MSDAYPPLAQLELLADTIGASTITGNHASLSDPWGTSRANSGDTACQFAGCTAPSFSTDPSKRTWTPTNINGFAPDLHTPYQVQLNASVQWEPWRGLSLEGSYVRNRAKDGYIVLDENLAVWTPTANTGNVNARRPNQTWRAIQINSNQALEEYDAGQFAATLRRRTIYARLTYTFQNSLATGDDEGQEVGIANAPNTWTDNPRDVLGEMGLVAPPQVVRGAFVVDLPKFEDNAWLDGFFGNWQVGGDFTWTDGENLNVTLGPDWNVDGVPGDRPDQVGPINYIRTEQGPAVRLSAQINWSSSSSFPSPFLSPTPPPFQSSSPYHHGAQVEVTEVRTVPEEGLPPWLLSPLHAPVRVGEVDVARPRIAGDGFPDAVEVLVELPVLGIHALFGHRGRRATEVHGHRRVHGVRHADVRVLQQEEHDPSGLGLGEGIRAGSALGPAAARGVPARHGAPVLRVVPVQVQTADAVLVRAAVAVVIDPPGGIMVQDNVTGLIWENKTDDGSIHDKDNTYNWQDAQDVFISTLNSQNFGGHNDWRLPMVKELSSIVDNGIPSARPTINLGYFPNTVSDYYWSSTTYAGYPSYAWFVSFYDGPFDGTSYKSYGYYARAVRGGQ